MNNQGIQDDRNDQNSGSSLYVPSADAMYRAALTFCLDDADAMMYALLKGAGDAATVWHLLRESHPKNPSSQCAAALGKLDLAFTQGLVRWGRKPQASVMKTFHTALAGWHNRMQDMPSDDPVRIADWFTVDGTQWLIGPDSPYWPGQLEDLALKSDWAPPLCLWGKGDPQALTSCPKPVGIVGSRDVTEYGRYVAHTLAEQAAALGHTVVSGGAMGTDAAAHWGALNAFHGRRSHTVGRTVAVFAGGLNHMGPTRNRSLFERIETQSGALISELCPNTIPEARRFLLRNRIIAALSSTVVVAQARLRSGALNTAGWAYELMREVYAAPGDINQPANAGCNRIISENRAALLCAATDVESICHEAHHPSTEHAAHSEATAPQPTLRQVHAEPASRHTCKPGSPSTASSDMRTVTAASADGPRSIHLNALPEPQRVLASLIKECHRRHLIATPDALLKMARQQAPNEISDIGTVLELVGAMELSGIIRRQADEVVFSTIVD